MARPPSYGLIYNWDGNPHGYSEYPQSTEDFLDSVRFDGFLVDAVPFWECPWG